MLSYFATDDPVVWRVDLPVTRLCCAKTAQQIEVLFWVKTVAYPRRKSVPPDPLQRVKRARFDLCE